METYIFFDNATGESVYIEAESHPEAIDIAYETMTDPEFVEVLAQ